MQNSTENTSVKIRHPLLISFLVGITLMVIIYTVWGALKTGELGFYSGPSVEKKIKGLNPSPLDVRADRNGDTLTGTGTFYEYTSPKKYTSPRQAVEDTFKDLSSIDIPIPNDNQLEKPESVSFESYDRIFNGSNVGLIQINYRFDNGSLSIMYRLDTELTCDFENQNLYSVCKTDRMVETLDGLDNPQLTGTAIIGGDINALI